MDSTVNGATLNDQGSHRVLIVDDLKDNVTILKAFLSLKKYQTFGAYDGVEGLRLARELKPDLILLDINMPKMDGLDLCREIRKDPDINNTGIILLTAASHIDDLINGFNAGADDFLRKPFQHLEMLARVRSVINMRDIQARLREVNGQLDNMNANLENLVAEQVHELERVNNLKRYFSPQLVETFLQVGKDTVLNNQRREITVVFLDLRNFTAFSEAHDPEEVMEALGDFHQLVGPIIFEYQATLERFTGDGLMCFLGAPQEMPDHAEKALQMSIRLQEAMVPLTAQWVASGYELKLGIGMATGVASTGVIGFEGRLDYAAIGSVTNLASRLCGSARAGEILLPLSTQQSLVNDYDLKEMGDLSFKGFSGVRKVFSHEVK